MGFEPFAVSSASVYPSPSSSVSVISGVPSLSVSLRTMISIVLLTIDPLGFLALTGISNFLDSSLAPQLLILGVPSIV